MSNYGLRGHETVVRLVGKRRKLTLSAISPQKSDSRDVKHEVDGSSVVSSDGINTEHNVKRRSVELKSITYNEADIRLQTRAGEASGSASDQNPTNIHQGGGAAEQKVGHIDWVNCPICEKSIRGDVINTHLDMCLQGGVKDIKKKSKQLTMSQFGGTSCNGKLSDRSLSLGFQRMSTDENQEGFRSVKIETRVTFGRPKPTIGGDSSMDGKETGRGSVQVEEKENTPRPEDIEQTRMRPKRVSRKDSRGTSDFHPIKEEPGHAVDYSCASVCFGRNSEHAIQSETSWQAEKSELDSRESGTDKMLDGFFEESISSRPVSERECSCHCHVSLVNSDVKGDAGRDEVSLENLSGFLSGDTKEIGAGQVVKAEPMDPSGVHSTNITPANDKLVGVLDTKIVGRRYKRGTACKEGMKVAVLREPDNPKDPNAIKVIEYGNPSGLALGHLPREISLHLSSLLDKGLLLVWGSITAVPAAIFGAVPVKLFCESRISLKEDFLKLDGAEESLQNLMDAAESLSSLQLPVSGSVSKYQENFLYMLQTVLERDSHLFKDQEKAFLEKFSSLSDDAQRLFIRLYQRKGPWFRLSMLEYKDVGDVGMASEELLAGGYMDVHDSPDEVPEAALRKRFEVLSVLELRHFVCTNLLKKKSEAAAARKDVLANMAVAAGMQKHGNLLPESPGQSGSAVVQMLSEVAGKCARVSDMADFLLWRVKVSIWDPSAPIFRSSQSPYSSFQNNEKNQTLFFFLFQNRHVSVGRGGKQISCPLAFALVY